MRRMVQFRTDKAVAEAVPKPAAGNGAANTAGYRQLIQYNFYVTTAI